MVTLKEIYTRGKEMIEGTTKTTTTKIIMEGFFTNRSIYR